jgi:hypothetical protein
MGGIFSLDINDTLLLSRVVLTFSVFLLIYTFVLLLSREKTVAVSSATIIILADAVLDPRGLISFLHGESPVSFLVFGQPVMPATIYLFFFSFLVAFLQFFRTRVLGYGVLSAFLLGLNFYNYFYAWTYLYAFGGLLGLFLLFKKRWKDAIGVAGVYIGALIVAVPYIVNLHRATLYATYAEVSERVGILYTHAPLFVGVVVLISIVIFFLGYPKEDKEQYLFSLALLLTPFVTLNQQILTGKVMQAGHYHYYLHKPIAIILSLIVVFAFLTRKKLYIYKNALGIFAIGVSIFVHTR